MDLRETIARLTTYRCAWTIAEAAKLAEISETGVKKYVTALTRVGVLILTGNQYSAGPQAKAWRSQPRKAKGPATYGNSAKYRATRALWDDLKLRDWQTKRQGKAAILTSQEGPVATVSHQQPPGDTEMAKASKLATYYTVEQVAAELGHHENTIRRLIQRGKLTAIRTGERAVRISQAALDEYTARNVIAAEAKA